MSPEEETVLRAHLSSGKYLPPEMQDFHDAKDLFKTIGDRDMHMPGFPVQEKLSWRNGMVYTIDHFLHFMAIHGYELKKVKGKVPRKDLAETIEAGREERNQAFRQHLEQSNGERQDASRPESAN